MVALILLVVSVGLADAVNPSTLAPALLIATGPDAERKLAQFTLGVFAVSLAGGLVLLLGPGQLLLQALPHPDAQTKAVAELVGGAVLVALAAVLWRGHKQLAARLASADSDGSSRGALALGAGIMALELPTALPYFAAIAALLASPFSLGFQIALVVLYNIAFVAPLLALLLVRRLAGERATVRLEAIGAWMRERAPRLLAAILAILGLVLAGVGITNLI